MKRLWTTLTLMLLGCPSTDPGPVDPVDVDQVGAFLADMEAKGFSGVVLIDDRGTVTTRAMGLADREAERPMAEDTVFDIGSVTKQFTAAAIVRLEMEGRLTVEDRIGDHLPDLPADRAAITLHQLLTHTAGLPVDLGPDYEVIDRATYLERFRTVELISAPGERHEYSNLGYSLLAIVVENASGMDYESYLFEALFRPAGMTDTGYVRPGWSRSQIAVGYGEDEVFGRPNEQPWAEDGPSWHLRGNGGILSTAPDMHRWHLALVGDKILDEAARAKLYRPHTPEGPEMDTFYGYGWALFPTTFDTTLVAHDGGNGIFFAEFLRFLDEDVTIFLATNAMLEDFDGVGFKLANEVFETDIIDPSFFQNDGPDCGPESLEGLDAFPRLDTFPATPGGDTAKRLFELLLGEPSDDEIRTFIERHLSATYMLTPDQALPIVADLQRELAGLTVSHLFEESNSTLHVALTDGSDTAVVVTVIVEPEDLTRIGCLAFTY